MNSIRNKIPLLVLPVLAAMVLGGCGGSATPEPSAVPAGTQDPAYPAPEGQVYEPPYPVDDGFTDAFYANLTPEAPAPEFSDSTGAGTLTMNYSGFDRPVRGQTFMLAIMLPVDGIEDAYIPKLDQTVAPKGASDSHGTLVISNVEPGRYALVLITPLGPILVEDEATNDTVQFVITAGELTDLGTVEVLLTPEALEPQE